MNKQHGFTLIELVMVIVILGILAATAIPRFIDLSADAAAAAVQGVAGALGAASAINYATEQVSPALSTTVTDCTHVANVLEGGLPGGYTITGGAIVVGATATCTVTKDAEVVAATFTGHGVT